MKCSRISQILLKLIKTTDIRREMQMALEPTWLSMIAENNSSFISIPLARSGSIFDEDIRKLVTAILEADNQNISTFDLTEQKVADEGIAELTKLPNLRTLILEDNPRVTDKSIDDLLKCPALETVNLTLTSVTEEGFIKLLQSKTLKEIEFGDLQVSEKSVEHILRNHTIASIIVDDSLLSEESLEKVLQHLETNEEPIISYPEEPSSARENFPEGNGKNLPLISYPDTLFTDARAAKNDSLLQCELDFSKRWDQLIQQMSNQFDPNIVRKVIEKFLKNSSEDLQKSPTPMPGQKA